VRSASKKTAARQSAPKNAGAKQSPNKQASLKQTTPTKGPSKRSGQAPNVRSILAELRELGNANTAKIYARHGVTDPSIGLPHSELGKLAKRLGVQHQLALRLWDSGIHDARVLATKVADPALLDVETLEKWVEGSCNHILSAAVAGLVSRSPLAHPLAKKWAKTSHEWRAAAGWAIFNDLAARGELSDAEASTLLRTITRTIHAAKNRTRYSMNNALISIGGYMPNVREQAFEAAEKIGRVEVDHGKTGCKTPDAIPYMQKMIAHQTRNNRPA